MDKKIVVWGTGLIASRYMGSLQIDNISFFIDSDIKKNGNLFWGRRIVHPSLIDNWNELYVLLPYNYYEEIKHQLLNKRLIEKEDFSEYGREIFYKYIDLEKEVEDAIARLILEKKTFQEKTVIIADFIVLNKGYEEYFNKWNENMGGDEFVLFSDATWIPREYSNSKLGFPMWVLPSFFARELSPDCNVEVKITKQMKDFIEQNNCLKNGAMNLRHRHPNMPQYFEDEIVFWRFNFIKRAFQILKPKRVVIYCEFLNSHMIISDVCKQLGIPVIYTHQGVLPGTFSFEEIGEMGESLPSRFSLQFLTLPVSEKELEQAEKVKRYLQRTRLNRKIQPQLDMNSIRERIEPQMPIVFYAGQKDTDSGFVPYTEFAKEFHSPIFSSSVEAAVYLAKLCDKKRWNFIFKPHPMEILTKEEKNVLPDNVILMEQGDINDLIDLSDVVVTIFSQTAYISLIRNKPTVMLGYNQLKNKECCYEAFKEDQIEYQIEMALSNGMSENQKEKFVSHVAQLLKYYLYDDYCDRELRYGKGVPKNWKDVERLKKILMEKKEER